jgi:hypothetical protein
VREQTASGPETLLVSRDELEGGKPAPAPACKKGAASFAACAETAVTPVNTQFALTAYVYASPDGSRAFFVSKDKLAKSAQGKEPEGPGPWTYEFNVNEKKVTYLPGVVGPIAASSQDGKSLIFKNTEQSKIELWSGGPEPVEIASFSTPGKADETCRSFFQTLKTCFEGTGSKDGAVFVFNTNAVLKHESQTFNDSEELLQAYRYDVKSKRLSCLSCAPGSEPQRSIETGSENPGKGREIADEGRRVFFGTATKMVPAAVHEVENVYEWEQASTGSCHPQAPSEEREGGCVYLLSAGTSPDPSFYLDNDESGENVFFATRAGLVKGDTDESYDVYDARVNGGFPEPPEPAKCGGTCRSAGPAPMLPESLTSALGPSGNVIPTPPPPTVQTHGQIKKSLTRQQKLAKALKACAKKPKRQRAACTKRAKKLYGAKGKAKSNAGSRQGRR